MVFPRNPVRLSPQQIDVHDSEFEKLLNWNFPDEASFVTRILRDDIPQRAMFSKCQTWIYLTQSGVIAGFGTLDICEDYSEFADGKPHSFIPLLAANPREAPTGCGSAILEHLIAQAVILSRGGRCQPLLFLDVYTTSQRAIALYEKFAFEYVTSTPRRDPEDGDREYHVMVKRTSVAIPQNS